MLSASDPMMEQSSPSGLQMATIPNTEVFGITSEATGSDYDIYIFLPSRFSREKTYPVLVHPDAYFTFGGLSDMVRNLQDSELCGEFIVVGISYGAGWGQPGNMRFRDFTFVPIEDRPETGGAAAYLKFVGEELIPEVAKRYPVDVANVTFHGGSLGGTFGGWAMFQPSQPFRAFILSSPALTYGGNDIFSIEAAYAKENEGLPFRVFMTVGGAERRRTLADFFQFANILERRNYAGLKLKTYVDVAGLHQTAPMGHLPWVLQEAFPVSAGNAR